MWRNSSKCVLLRWLTYWLTDSECRLPNQLMLHLVMFRECKSKASGIITSSSKNNFAGNSQPTDSRKKNFASSRAIHAAIYSAGACHFTHLVCWNRIFNGTECSKNEAIQFICCANCFCGIETAFQKCEYLRESRFDDDFEFDERQKPTQ